MEKNKAYSNLALDTYLDGIDDARESAFATGVVYGVTERRITLDYFISKYSRNSLKRIKPEVMTALRIGLYQIHYMDKVPVSAAVNESVNLVKSSGNAYAAGFVNAVLRKSASDGCEIPLMKNMEEYYSIKYSFPAYLVNKLIKLYGLDNALHFMESSLKRPPLMVRVNTLKTDTDRLLALLNGSGVTAVKHRSVENALILEMNGSVEELDAFKDGLFHVQDVSSQECCRIFDAKPGETVLDMCAAPGGKSITIAEYMDNRGTVYSFDLYRQRAGLIDSTAHKMGIFNIKVDQNDASVYNKLIPTADRVLCDVPCSGFGVVRRKPEIKYKSLSEIEKLPELQFKILEQSSRYVRSGGILMYSTCTLNNAENENVVNCFLNCKNDFELEYMKTFISDEWDGDGFFVAKLKKRN